MVVDAGQIAGGKTSRTKAHLVNALDKRYVALERLHGEKAPVLWRKVTLPRLTASKRSFKVKKYSCLQASLRRFSIKSVKLHNAPASRSCRTSQGQVHISARRA